LDVVPGCWAHRSEPLLMYRPERTDFSRDHNPSYGKCVVARIHSKTHGGVRIEHAGTSMAYWFCLLCNERVEAVPGEPEPSDCPGHQPHDPVTYDLDGVFWELRDTCPFCGREYQVGANRCYKCKNFLTDDSPLYEAPPKPPSPGCGGCVSQGCLISFIGFAALAGAITRHLIRRLDS